MNKESIKYLLFFIIILCWTILPFISKKLLQKYPPMDYFILTHFISFTFITCIGLWLYSKNEFSFLKQIDKKDWKYIFGVAILGLIAGLSFTFLIKDTNLSYLRSHIDPLVIVLTTLFGSLLFEENIGFTHWIGIIIIIVGLYIVNKANHKSKT